MSKKSLTLTVVANMTANYSEGLGNIASVQKIYRQGKAYAIRSRESLKRAIMDQAGMYDDLQTVCSKGVIQKNVGPNCTAAEIRGLEGGYMNTGTSTKVRNSSMYFTDAVSVNPLEASTRFHNNLGLATNFAKANGLSVQDDAKDCGLMPFQYEYKKGLCVYSCTIALNEVGVDENFGTEAAADEKAVRVKAVLRAIQNLSLVVKGSLDNAEPIFVAGGLSDRKTHYFENVVCVKDNKLVLSEDLQSKLAGGFHAGVLHGNLLENTDAIAATLQAGSVSEFFDTLCNEVDAYYA